MPVSRARVLGVRAATAVAELLALALIPSLMLPLLSPAVGQSYGFADALVHGTCVFVAGLIFFSLAFLLSSVFSDIWRPLLIARYFVLTTFSAAAGLWDWMTKGTSAGWSPVQDIG